MAKSTTSRSRKPDTLASEDPFTSVGPPYVDKAALAESGELFAILGVELELGKGWEGSDRWCQLIQIKGRDPAFLTLGCNPLRDIQMQAAQAFLRRGGKLINKRLCRAGDAYYIVSGE